MDCVSQYTPKQKNKTDHNKMADWWILWRIFPGVRTIGLELQKKSGHF